MSTAVETMDDRQPWEVDVDVEAGGTAICGSVEPRTSVSVTESKEIKAGLSRVAGMWSMLAQ